MEINFKTKDGLDQFSDLIYSIMVRCYNEHIKPDMEAKIDKKIEKVMQHDTERIDAIWGFEIPFKIGKKWYSLRNVAIVILILVLVFFDIMALFNN